MKASVFISWLAAFLVHGSCVHGAAAVTVIPAAPAPVGQSVMFDAAGSGTGTIQYSWNFGDGTAATAFSTTSTAAHSYVAPGHYPVQVTVMDSTPSTATASYTQTIFRPATTPLPAASSTIIFDSGANRVWNVNADTDTVSAVDAVSLTRVFERPVGKNPRTLARAPDGAIWVVNQGDATISVLNSADGTTQTTLQLPRGSLPYGIAFAPDGSAAFVTLQGGGGLVKIDAAARVTLGTAMVGAPLRGVAITGDSQRVLATRFVSPQDRGEIIEFSAALAVTQRFDLLPSPGPDNSFNGRGIPNYISSITIQPDGLRAWVPSKKDNTLRGLVRDGLPLTFETTIRTIVSQIDLGASVEDLPARVDLDNRDMAVAVRFTALGDYAFVAVQGSNRIEVLDAYTRLGVAAIPNTGLAPQGLALNAAGTRLFVQNFMSRTVSVYDVAAIVNSTGTSAPQLAVIPAVNAEKLAPAVLQGKQIFYNSADTRMSRDGYISCASCHLDAGQDGRVFDFTQRGEGLRNTTMLQGRRGIGHGPVHWTANFDEIQDFENDIRGAFGGTGFMSNADFNSGTRSMPLGDPKAGFSVELDALAAYLASLTEVNKSPFRDYQSNPANPAGVLTADGQAGKLIFNSLNCVACHAGSSFTDSPSRVLHDVGTIKPTSGQRIGQALTGFDTPTLKGVWETAPYLHDGSAPTLLDVITTANPSGLHGNTAALSAAQRQQLVAYLLQIDEDEPGNTLPDVAIVSPVEGTTFGAPANVAVVVSALDNGAIGKVELFNGAAKVGESTGPGPYSFNLTNVAAGAYSLTAVAADDLTATRTSAPVTFIVKPSATLTLGNLHQTFDGAPKPVSVETVPAGLSVTVTYDGNSTPPSQAGSYSVLAAVIDADFFGFASALLTIHPVLEIASVPVAFPASGLPGQAAQFSIAANQPGVTWMWDFGDGSAITTPLTTVSHIYTAAGSYTISVTGTQLDSQSASTILGYLVLPLDTDADGIADVLDDDDDNDGSKDVNEIFNLTNPLDPRSLVKIPLGISKLRVKLDFRAGGVNSAQVSGFSPKVTGFNGFSGGNTATLNMGGVIFFFNLDARGMGASGLSKLRLNNPFATEIVFKARLRGVDWAAVLADDRLIDTDVRNVSVTIPVEVIFGGHVYAGSANGTYSASAGRSGKFRSR